MIIRTLEHCIASIAASDGAGVKLRRSLGASQALRHDPFLLLDEFYSDDPDDYIAGFPPHPHRGFETVTYMLDGHMRHEDDAGNTGDLGPGDVQWMSAARGIVHSEMPQQSEGRMRGFQLWINLPARDKMKPAAYRDIAAGDIPVAALSGGVKVKVIAGVLRHEGGEMPGAIRGLSTDAYYFDILLPAGKSFRALLPEGHNALLYSYDGETLVGSEGATLGPGIAGLLSNGDTVQLEARDGGARVLLLAGRPIGEPIAQYGPFVMNTREEIEQAVADYRMGALSRDGIRHLKVSNP
jgi:quercetin 2,3-dioxygenase